MSATLCYKTIFLSSDELDKTSFELFSISQYLFLYDVSPTILFYILHGLVKLDF